VKELLPLQNGRAAFEIADVIGQLLPLSRAAAPARSLPLQSSAVETHP
jgi:hypothetical protein